MKAYSLDLCCMVIESYESGGRTIAEVAEQFGVGATFVKKLLRLHRAGQSFAPQYGGSTQDQLSDTIREQLPAAAKIRPDVSFTELKAVLGGVCRVEVNAPPALREVKRQESRTHRFRRR
ncbi:MAG: hypothetical protein AB7P18_07400 [Candidatus Binatia bacterium]